MTTLDLKRIQALHTLSQLPIIIMSPKLNLIQIYGNKEYLYPYYQLLKKLDLKLDGDMDIYQGVFEETFLIFSIKQAIISIGPFYSYNLDSTYKNKIADDFYSKFKDHEKDLLLAYMALVPILPSTNIRSLFITLDAFFDTSFEQKCQAIIYDIFHKAQKIVEKPQFITDIELLNTSSNPLPDIFIHLNHILKLVQMGNTEILKKEINSLPASEISSSPISALRTEKNLSIIYFSKLLELSFSENREIPQNYELVKHFVISTEEASNILEVLHIRCAALITFSESLANKSISDKKQIYNSILHYVDNHLYKKIKVSDIANHLYISESHLRSVFRRYSNISIQSHILKEKIKEAKLLLKRGLPISEVAQTLHFYDTTHFLKTFKKYTGMSPHDYIKCLFNDLDE
ncbi:YSIRK-targeted surface antigen transcriptional regulator [Streptococcus didelphis]|uniref:YSIRK-targeted surface antigen transcriptional regulator n=1 Tax=Streptococcus didelphis TaxID=102886 RepID=UPI00036A2DFB|nr:YSIRK-targeted surface antigen transcriptional regulator [Streptococcus didelphis]WMB29926.1 YSIRK-targeted surface antigen transcriptional regulator [Streptococcus didelphis]